jgi:hypothetical protein
MDRWMRAGAAAVLALGLAPLQAQDARDPDPEAGVIDGVTFAAEPGMLYAPVRELGDELELPVRWDGSSDTVYLGERPVSNDAARRLVDGTILLPVRDLDAWDAGVTWDAEANTARVVRGEREVVVRSGGKRVEINRAAQKMRAWQGERLVLETRVSTGRPGHATPTGSFRAGPYRARMHYSRLYDNAPMPWSVQVKGDIFIHGFQSVPPRAASHGCIRLPLTGANPARWFFRWVDNGAPIVIADGWS